MKDLRPVRPPSAVSTLRKHVFDYAILMEPVSFASTRPAAGVAAFAILGLIAIALALAKFDTVFPGAAKFPVSTSLIVFGLFAFAMGLREFSVRVQFADQAASLEASYRDLQEKARWLEVAELNAKMGYWSLCLKTETNYWSPGTAAIYGREPGYQASLDEAIAPYHPDDINNILDKVGRARELGEDYELEARLLKHDGSIRYVQAVGKVERDREGRPSRLYGMLRDRTDEELLIQELRDARDKANDLAVSKGLFLARMSHEIRTPMNGVLGFAELLSRSNLAPEQQRHTDLILESGKALKTLLNDILDLSKIEAGKVEINPGPVDIYHLIHRVTQMAEPAAREKGISIGYDTAHDLPRHVLVDALRLRQVLGNLMSNAVRFTDEGGVSLSASCVDGRLCFSVCDTGTGINAQMIENIFEPFTQESQHATSSRGGTGLGLAISRQLAELMGGRLTVRSEPGEGSVFTLTLPFVSASAPDCSAAPDGPPPLAASKPSAGRVLLVEDYDINRELITDMTRQLGVEIECAVDGVEAVSMIHHARALGRPYSLVLMDLQMPKLDGLEAAQRLRQGGVSEDELPIVALTANAFADDIENCLAAGMQAHLAKPLSMDRLAEALKKWMPKEPPAEPRREVGAL